MDRQSLVRFVLLFAAIGGCGAFCAIAATSDKFGLPARFAVPRHMVAVQRSLLPLNVQTIDIPTPSPEKLSTAPYGCRRLITSAN